MGQFISSNKDTNGDRTRYKLSFCFFTSVSSPPPEDGAVSNIDPSMNDHQFDLVADFEVKVGQDADVHVPKGGGKIAVKLFRGTAMNADKRASANKIISEYIAKLSQLEHKNIASVFNSIILIENIPALGMLYFPNGNVMEYLSLNPHADKVLLVKGFTSGLAYLHGHDIIHGNIAPTNVLVNDAGEGVLGDIGLSAALRSEEQSTRIFVPSTWMYKQAEYFYESQEINLQFTMEGDVCSWSRTIFEIFEGKPPFSSKNVNRCLMDLIEGKIDLKKPTSMSCELWGIVKRCGSHLPSDRLTMSMVEKEIIKL